VNTADDAVLGLPVSVVILAGGQGERLGQDKTTIELGGLTLLQRVIRTAEQLSEDIICVAREDQRITAGGVSIVRDPPGNSGVLPAILAGLQRASSDWVFLTACDMPFIQIPFVQYMLSLCDSHTIIVPKISAGLEPFHALYHHRVIPSLQAAINRREKRVVSFYHGQDIREVNENEIKRFDPHLISFFNINTDEDLSRAFELVTQPYLI